MSLIQVENLVKHFPKHGGFFNRVVAKVHAVNDVSLDIEKGETLGVVGESGCGKSTLGRVIVQLTQPTSGTVSYEGRNLAQLSSVEMLALRRQMQIIFQDPNSSLNPRMTVDAALKEVVKFHQIVPPEQVDSYINELITKVGLRVEDKDKYPHEFSGGQKQRVGIARALAVKPEFVVADEPISALDVSIQAQVLNLLLDLKEEFGLTMLFISHDLKVVDFFCDRKLVMYLGRVVESMPCHDANYEAKHPYTQALLAANPIADPRQRRELTVLEGDVPSPYNPPAGCPFVTRCPIKEARCETEMPPLVSHGDRHQVACWAVEPT